MNFWGFLAGGALGLVCGAGAAIWWRARKARRPGDLLAVDFQHALDLLRRAYGATVACLALDDEGSTLSLADPRPDQAVIDWAVATARLARGDGRLHTIPGDPGVVAVGDGAIGAALAVGAAPGAGVIDQAVSDLRRLVAGCRIRLSNGQLVHGDPDRAFAIALARLDSVESLSVALCESARSITDHPTAVVVRDPITQTAAIAAVSRVSDRKLVGARVSADSAAGRATMGEVPLVAGNLRELLGIPDGDRRRRHDAGVAYPLNTGQEGIGSLVVFARADALEPELQDRVSMLAAEVTPHLARAAAVRAAETRALTDELTGLPNRRALARALRQRPEGPVAVLMVDLDHFKRLNDGFGHAAGDAALRLMAQVFERTLREGDVAARYGGEEFVLLLRGAGPATALEVAERVRRATAEAKLTWAGAELKLACSIGVAAHPEPIRDIANLTGSADAALLRAKAGGRNRVEMAGGS